jgi:single-strand DNA-binding protein
VIRQFSKIKNNLKIKKMNQVCLLGGASDAPKTTTFDGGKKKTTFSLATTEGYGEKAVTTWHNITCWGEYGENVGKYIVKGTQVAIIGKIRNDSYEKDGVKMYRSEIVADKIELISGTLKKSETDGTSQTTTPSVTQTPQASKPVVEDDLPF